MALMPLAQAVTGLAIATMAVADNPYDDEKNDVILPLDVSSQSRDFPQPRHCPVPITITGHDMQEVLRETKALSNFTSPSPWSLNILGRDPYYLTCTDCLPLCGKVPSPILTWGSGGADHHQAGPQHQPAKQSPSLGFSTSSWGSSSRLW